MARSAPRTRIEQLAQDANLSIQDFARQFEVKWRETGERGAGPISDTNVKRWFAGTQTPRSHARRVLAEWWGEPIEKLLGPPDTAVTRQFVSEEELILTAGRESSEHALKSASALDPSAIEHLEARAYRAARSYYIEPATKMLTKLVDLRDDVYELIERTNKPGQKSDLYKIAALSCGLLSSVSWDLGHPDAAEEQARSAHTYGSLIDHPSICSWANALLVTVLFWSGDPQRAARIASDVLPLAPEGTAKARLHAVRARALAFLGARDEVRDDLSAALNELEHGRHDSFADEIGGELAFDHARHALCAGAAYVALREGEEAEAAANTALMLFEQVPQDQRWQAGQFGAVADLAMARMLRDDLAGTEEALRPVLELPQERRTEALSQRLTLMRSLLGTERYRGAQEARRIDEAIDGFTERSLARTTAQLVISPSSAKL